MKSAIWRAAAVGMMSLMGTCVGSCCDQAWRFNPCGTIFGPAICTPDEWYARVFDSPDWGVDPACPIPNQCQ